MVTHVLKPGLPKTVTIGMVPKPFERDGSYILIAAWKDQEHTGPFGHGNTVGEAINVLVDTTEALFAAEDTVAETVAEAA